MSHGRVYSLVASEVLDMMNRPEYKRIMAAACRRISLLKAANMLKAFFKVVKTAFQVLTPKNVCHLLRHIDTNVNLVYLTDLGKHKDPHCSLRSSTTSLPRRSHML